ncbi:uncharacterized protein PV09_05990 [Verruconis gallopava]|uniref:1-phosphatidylinositol-4-phosphate 5-kinase n=1 Tax=Verruconis gallopava TaxID=253628 RepID=A0A0D2A8Q4_9PEZI|nr:uncharacterized protein PV09_05990 [Verruconis gallopava]KIW02945.1 hypothetical protein PV09_05990 [Verruconis gallopava]
MLHSIDMPSFLAEDAIPPTSGINGSHSSFHTRKSVERTHSGTGSFKDGYGDKRANGELVNGVNGSGDGMHLANGHRTRDEKRSMENGGPVEPVPRRSRASQEREKPVGLDRLSTRDDGYFASVSTAKVQEGWFSNKVSLDMNGIDGAVYEKRETSASRDEGRIERKSIADTTGRSSGDRTSESLRPSREQPHRISAPPAPSSHSAQNLLPPNKLQQRHTLEVPRVSTSRLSKETTNTFATEEAVATGRFSPSTPTRRRNSISLVRRVTRSIHSDVYLDDLPQDPEAAAYTEMVKQKRQSRRDRKREEEEDRVLVGTKVDQNHVNYVMAYNMLTGIRFTVSRTNAKMDRDLTDMDFEAKHKFSFDVTGAELTPSAKYDFKFKDYAPWVFRHLRAIFKIDPADYLMSLTSKYILSELGSPGKSGSFFYFSRDYKYIIKTIHHSEHKLLRSMLKDYYRHVRENPNTLLSQFYGLHRVKIPFGRKVHFVVMNNLFPPHRDIHKTYDLKGSTVGRLYKEENLVENPRATLKDLNWLNSNNHLEFGPRKREAFIQQMERDVKLLQRMKIMDYSLLVGIHDLKRGNEEQIREKTLQVFQPGGDNDDAEDDQPSGPLTRTMSKLETARKAKELRHTLRTEKPVPMSQTTSKMPEEMEQRDVKKGHYFYQDDGGFRASHEDDSPGDVIYYLGIIDCLTHYGAVKRLEHFWKALSNDEKQISPIPPERYGERFVRFISGITKSPELVAQEKANAENAADSPDDANTHSAGRFSRRRSSARDSESRSAPGVGDEEDVLARAERSAQHASRELERDDARPPDKKLTTTRSPSAERGESGGFTLPVVEEEDKSTGGRSNDEREQDAETAGR